MLEIEAKARIKSKRDIKRRILEAGGVYLRTETQEDAYFAHPDPERDFAKTDEALRLRMVGKDYFLTYKGKKLDYQTKTREEIEIKIKDGPAIAEILDKLGFVKVKNVIKTREYYALDDYWVAIDDVMELGQFVEIEKHGEEYTPDELFKMMERLGIDRGQTERKSYLELLFEKEGGETNADGENRDV
jgi:adenylate cyclase class 2